ncbi:hypothetical protein F4680DRAFT_433790 [Xylaria scruposa]|nr:hypothetical protein F4680DRAFT_433790 [Xylaria scruposa]
MIVSQRGRLLFGFGLVCARGDTPQPCGVHRSFLFFYFHTIGEYIARPASIRGSDEWHYYPASGGRETTTTIVHLKLYYRKRGREKQVVKERDTTLYQ